MKEPRTLNEILTDIQVDLASVKTDVIWLKRLFISALVFTGAIFGADITGIVI